jgi:hypothetical protein
MSAEDTLIFNVVVFVANDVIDAAGDNTLGGAGSGQPAVSGEAGNVGELGWYSCRNPPDSCYFRSCGVFFHRNHNSCSAVILEGTSSGNRSVWRGAEISFFPQPLLKWASSRISDHPNQGTYVSPPHITTLYSTWGGACRRHPIEKRPLRM